MTFIKPLYVLGVVIVNVLALAVTSSARPAPEGSVVKLERRDSNGRPVYSWLIGTDEEKRLTEMLEHDFYSIGMAGTYVTAPPQVCPVCGKETEFIDWVYTALERGIHSPEFIVEALKESRSPKNVHHDVYCSGCGHLTPFQDRSGREGLAPHISEAPAYDRLTKTFLAPNLVVYKREDASAAELAGFERDDAETEKLWYPDGNWEAKREDLGKEFIWDTMGDWGIKREHLKEREEPEVDYIWTTEEEWAIKRDDVKDFIWISDGDWAIKREESSSDFIWISDGDWALKREEPSSDFIWISDGDWALKREDIPTNLWASLGVLPVALDTGSTNVTIDKGQGRNPPAN